MIQALKIGGGILLALIILSFVLKGIKLLITVAIVGAIGYFVYKMFFSSPSKDEATHTNP